MEDIPSWRQFTGQSEEEVKGWGWSKAVHPDDLEHTAKVWKNAITLRKRYETEYRILRYDGVYRQFLARGVPVFKDNGNILEWVGTCVDITDHKQVEETLRQSREDLAHAQAIGQIGSWRLDIGRNVLTWSDENHRIFGLPKDTPMSYETFLGVVHPDDRQSVDTQWKAGLAGRPYDVEHRIVVDGQVKWVREKAYLEFDDAGKLLGGFGITQDITERKNMESALQKAHANLERKVEQRTAELQKALSEVQILRNCWRPRIFTSVTRSK